jgi:drug/metabolite transporter (DMT)-like permease
MIGLVLVVLDTDGGNATWYGDLLAFGAAITITFILLIGTSMLKDKEYPLFVWLFPVSLSGAIFSYIFALIVQEEE